MSDGAQDEAMLTAGEVGEFFGGKKRPLTRATIWKWVGRGKLAPPVKIDKKTVRWRLSDCKRVRDEMIAQSQTGDSK
jgi:predicted DNA-binding transcriptional regulator AlpA